MLIVRYGVTATFSAYTRSSPLDLAALDAGDSGGTALVELPLRCLVCGSQKHAISVSGGGYGYPT